MKVSFVGSGRVGSLSAFVTLMESDVDKIAMVDPVKGLAKGQALDLSHASAILDMNTKITGSTKMSDIKGSDVIVVTAGFPRKAGQKKIELLGKNAEIISSIANKIKRYAPRSKVIVVTNPVDPLTYVMWKKTGFNRKRVFGVGNLLDTGRLISLGKDSVVIGQHGEFLVPLTKSPDKVAKNIKKVNNEVIKLKGRTEFGASVETGLAVVSILEDLKSEMPVSAILKGEYGVSDVSIGVPVVIGSRGVEEIIELELTEAQKKLLMKAVLAVDMSLDSLGLK